MTTVKIDRSTIKKNPKAGNTVTTHQGMKEISFEINGKYPSSIEADEDIIFNEWSSDYARGVITNPSKIDLIRNLPGASISVQTEKIETYHLPAPEYLFKYENPTVECNRCKSKVHVNDIETEWFGGGEDYDEYEVTYCPVCHETGTFEEISYESIDDALKEGSAK